MEQQRELQELERVLRTVFVYQLHPKASLKEMHSLFKQAGKVTDIRVITDRYTGRSKGFGTGLHWFFKAQLNWSGADAGYIEFAKKESILPALALNGQLLNGHPVLVKPSESEKNAAAQLAKTQSAMMNPTADTSASRCFIGNLHVNVREEDLRDVFSPFGLIESVEVHVDQSDLSGAGFAFIQ